MRVIKTLSIAIMLLNISGCIPNPWAPKPVDIDRASVAQEMRTASFNQAEFYYAQGKYNQAIIEYRKYSQATKNIELHAKCMIGIAKSLIKTKQYSAAVSTLKPLDLEPANMLQRQTLAVAGEALMRLGKFKEAEAILEISLDDMTKKTQVKKSWRVGAFGNLACAYLKNNKIRKAAVMYKKTAQLLRQKGDFISAKRAERMQSDLEIMIKQYAPFKPLPVIPELPAGK